MINTVNTMTIPLEYAVQQVMIRSGIPEKNRQEVRAAIEGILDQFPDRRVYIDEIPALLPPALKEGGIT